MNTVPFQPSAAPPDDVTLENCDREPIHTPGAIQSHGVLLAIDGCGRIRHASANSAQLWGQALLPGERLAIASVPGQQPLQELIGAGLAALRGQGELPMPLECRFNGSTYDVVTHLSHELLVVEFEQRHHSRDALAGFALQAHRAMERLRRPHAIDSLLQLATEELQALTGFDRVMAYRFRHDSSGDVVAESRIPALEPYLGRRYPASDIPAQARRLYTINTLRMIADVRSTPVALLSASAEPALDLSAGILRSVSPIHIEYLGNMGVGASMSLSIVINGQLWGLLACHHMQARQVPYSVRMASDVIAQLLAANIQSALAHAQGQRQQAMAQLRGQLLQDMLHGDDEFGPLSRHAGALAGALHADGAVVMEHGRLHLEGNVSGDTARSVAQWLDRQHPDGASALCHTHALPLQAPELAGSTAPWCGVLALPLHTEGPGNWLVFLRKEQIETIHWGGKPEKHVQAGPRGPRLTPRGSFELWKETVRSTSEHWSEGDLQLARQLLQELTHIRNARQAEMSRARTQLMAILGHDLRDPLHSISMAARVLEKSGDSSHQAGRLGQRIQSSSSRMQRLVSQVMDLSRLQAQLGLDLQPTSVDLAPLLLDLIDEARMAHPGILIEAQLPQSLLVHADPDRIAQVFVNLLSNARHHGQTGEPLEVRAFKADAGHHVQVRNAAQPIAQELAEHLFKPFKPSSVGNARNRSGLGLGLYIAQQIVQDHGGTLEYGYEAPHVVFTLVLP